MKILKVEESCNTFNDIITDLQKHKRFTQFKFNICFLHNFFWLLKGNHGQNEEIYTELKKITQRWVGGLRVFPGLIIYFNCNHAITCFCMLQKHPTLLTIIDMHMCPPMDKP